MPGAFPITGQRTDAVLDYWFRDPRNGAPDLAALNRFWFGKSDVVDAYIRRCFDAKMGEGEIVALTVQTGRGAPTTLSGVVEWVEERSASTVLELRIAERQRGATCARHDPPVNVCAMDGSRATLEINSDFRRATEELPVDGLDSGRDALAAVVLLDQFPRNMFRGTPRAFAHDPLALTLSRRTIARGLAEELSLVERAFLGMPMEHSEDLVVQEEGVRYFGDLLAAAKTATVAEGELLEEFKHYAEVHCRIVQRFGRFPHRNAVLGRASTPEELRFLEEEGSSF